MTRQEQLQEQMEDTVFALLMNEVMQRESGRSIKRKKRRGMIYPFPKIPTGA